MSTENKNNKFAVQLNEQSSVKKVIGIISGKGGVGKSLVTSLLAVAMNRKGYQTAIMDSDITGPSIPKTFGLKEKAVGRDTNLYPVQTANGIKVMSINLLLEDETDPVVWRGPLIANVVKQFWTDVVWGDVDFMFIDMPPGTGDEPLSIAQLIPDDVPLTVFQSIAVDGIIVVTSPQELVSMVVSKAVKMATKMGIPIIGLVENMSYFRCPDNDKAYKIFGDSHIEDIAAEYQLEILAKIPIVPDISAACDKGTIEAIDGDWLDELANRIESVEVK